MIIPETTGIAVAPGPNQGWAQVLGQSSFDGPAFVRGLVEEKRKKELQDLERQHELRKKNADFLLKLPEKANVSPWLLEESEQILQKFEDQLSELSAKSGVDLTTDPQAIKLFRDFNSEVARLQSYDKQIIGTVNKYSQLIGNNPEKYDSTEYEEWLKGLEATKGKENKFKYVQSVQPWMDKFDMIEWTKENAINPNSQMNGLMRETSVDFPRAKAALMFDIFATKTQNPDEWNSFMDYVEAGKKEGKWEGIEGAVEDAARQVVRLAGKQETMFSGGASFGGGSQAKGLGVTASKSPAFSQYGGANEVMFTQQGGDLKPVAMSGYKGTTEFVKPEKVVFKKNAAGKDQWFVVGPRAKRVTGDQIEQEAKRSNMDAIRFAAQQGFKLDPENPTEYVSIRETETIELPVSNAPNTYGEANYKKLSEIMGEDFYEFIKRQNEGYSAPAQTKGANPAGAKPEKKKAKPY